jgi:hypothetical protein
MLLKSATFSRYRHAGDEVLLELRRAVTYRKEKLVAFCEPF